MVSLEAFLRGEGARLAVVDGRRDPHFYGAAQGLGAVQGLSGGLGAAGAHGALRRGIAQRLALLLLQPPVAAQPRNTIISLGRIA